MTNTKPQIEKLDLSDYTLRPLAMADADMIRNWRNQEHIQAVMYQDHEIEAEEHHAWMQKVVDEDTSHYFVFCHQGKPIGLCGLYNFSEKDDRAVWMFYLGEKNTPKGAGSAMWFLLLDHAFGTMGLRKICSEVLAINEGVVRMHIRFGFAKEGILRAQTIKDGEPVNAVIFGMLRDEWKAARQEQWYIAQIPDWNY